MARGLASGGSIAGTCCAILLRRRTSAASTSPSSNVKAPASAHCQTGIATQLSASPGVASAEGSGGGGALACAASERSSAPVAERDSDNGDSMAGSGRDVAGESAGEVCAVPGLRASRYVRASPPLGVTGVVEAEVEAGAVAGAASVAPSLAGSLAGRSAGIVRGATGTTPLSSTGPCAGSTGGGGSVKSRGDCCAAAGVAIRMTADRIRAEFARIAPFIPAQDGAALNGSGLPIVLHRGPDRGNSAA